MSQFSAIRSGFGRSDNTETEYDNEVRLELLTNRLEQISEACRHLNATHNIYVVGMGAQHRSVFELIKRMDGARVLFCRSVLPGVSKILSPIIASHAGLVRIDDVSALIPVFSRLTNRGMAGIYLCSRESSVAFESMVSAHKQGASYDFGIKADAGYFFYVVDADNDESHTGMFEIVSYGRTAPNALKI